MRKVWGAVFISVTTVFSATGTWFFLTHDRFYSQPYILFAYIFSGVTWASIGGPACFRLIVDEESIT